LNSNVGYTVWTLALSLSDQLNDGHFLVASASLRTEELACELNRQEYGTETKQAEAVAGGGDKEKLLH
jgi:hypothetical protein